MVSKGGRRLVIVYLIVGVLPLCCLVAGPGVYSGHFSGSITLGDGEAYVYLHLNTETAPQWYWVHPRNHRYDNVTLKIIAGTHSEATVNLQAGTWQAGPEKGSVHVDGLARLFAPRDAAMVPDQYRQQVEAVVAILHALRDGTAPPVMHHGHQVESPFRASYQHSSPGADYGFSALWVWLTLWPLCLLVVAAQSRRSRFTPILAFLITLAVMAALDTALIVVGMIFSPGPVSELMEFLLGLINAPAMIVLGPMMGGWALLVLGALGWATVISIVVLIKKKHA